MKKCAEIFMQSRLGGTAQEIGAGQVKKSLNLSIIHPHLILLLVSGAQESPWLLSKAH